MFSHWWRVVGTISALRDATGVFAHPTLDEPQRSLIHLHQVILTELSAAHTVEQAAQQIKFCAKRVFNAEHVAVYVTNGNADSVLYMEACTDKIMMPSPEFMDAEGHTIDLAQLGHKAGLIGDAVRRGVTRLAESLERETSVYNPNLEAHGLQAHSMLVCPMDSPLSGRGYRFVLGAIQLINKQSTAMNNFVPGDKDLMDTFRVAAANCLHTAMMTERTIIMGKSMVRFQRLLRKTQDLDVLNLANKVDLRELASILNAELVVLWEAVDYETPGVEAPLVNETTSPSEQEGSQTTTEAQPPTAVAGDAEVTQGENGDAVVPSWEDMEKMMAEKQAAQEAAEKLRLDEVEKKKKEEEDAAKAAKAQEDEAYIRQLRPKAPVKGQGEFIRSQYVYGESSRVEVPASWSRVGFGKAWSVEHCYKGGAVLHIEDVEASGLYNAVTEPQPPPRQHGVNAAVLAPIITSSGKCYGVIQVLCKHNDFGHFSDEDKEYVNILAVELAALYSQREQKAEVIEQAAKLETLVRVSAGNEVWRDAMAGEVNTVIPRVVESVLATVLHFTRCEYSQMFLVDKISGQLLRITSHGTWDNAVTVTADQGLVRQCLNSLEPLHIPDVKAFTPSEGSQHFLPSVDCSRSSKCESLALAPMFITTERVVGAIMAVNKVSRDPILKESFTEWDQQVLSAVANQAGIAIEACQYMGDAEVTEKQAQAWSQIASNIHAYSERTWVGAAEKALDALEVCPVLVYNIMHTNPSRVISLEDSCRIY